MNLYRLSAFVHTIPSVWKVHLPTSHQSSSADKLFYMTQPKCPLLCETFLMLLSRISHAVSLVLMTLIHMHHGGFTLYYGSVCADLSPSVGSEEQGLIFESSVSANNI